jgi:hypothetical protein
MPENVSGLFELGVQLDGRFRASTYVRPAAIWAREMIKPGAGSSTSTRWCPLSRRRSRMVRLQLRPRDDTPMLQAFLTHAQELDSSSARVMTGPARSHRGLTLSRCCKPAIDRA